MSKEHTFSLGDWLVELDTLSIQNKHQCKNLDSKVMQLLIYLVKNRERVVSRNELLDQLWKNQVVADDVLNVAISSLRKALGDDFKTPSYIRTIPRKGYQLIAPVKAVPSNKRSIKLNWLIAVLLVLVIALPLWSQFSSTIGSSDLNSDSSPNPSEPIRIAVLPFDYYSANLNREYIADGITEAIINRLVQQTGLLVTSRTSVMQYKIKKAPIKEVVEQLNVEWVLEGSVQLEDDKIQVTVQLIDAVKDVHVWSETYQQVSSDLLEIQTDIAHRIVDRLDLSSKQIGESNRHSNTRKIPAAAYERFMQAQFFHYKGENEKAVKSYQKAIDLYPDYAEAYAHLSHSYFSQSYSRGHQAAELIDQASVLAVKALQIDPNPAYVQLVTALTHLYREYDYHAAGQAFRRAFERNNQDLMILEWYIEYLLIVGQFDKAEQLAKHMATISPLAYNKVRTYEALYYRGDYKKAEKELADKSAILSAKTRESLYVWNSLAADNQNTLLNHAPLFLKELELQQDIIDEFMVLLKENGKKSALKFIVEKIPVFDNYDKARFYASAGENEKAISLLQDLVATKNLQILKLAIEPSFESLKEESSYISLLNALKLNRH